MTVIYTNWPHAGIPLGTPYNKCSPNLDAVCSEIGKRFGGYNLGCYGVRDIRVGGTLSVHSWGAAKDWRIDDDNQRAKAIPYLVYNFDVLGVQAVHDYVGCRIWHAWRTTNIEDINTKWWKAQTPNAQSGMGQSWAKWLHIETDPNNWPNDTPVPLRFQQPNVYKEDTMIVNLNAPSLPNGSFNPNWAATLSTGPHTSWLRNGDTYAAVRGKLEEITLTTDEQIRNYLQDTLTTGPAPENQPAHIKSLWESRRIDVAH